MIPARTTTLNCQWMIAGRANLASREPRSCEGGCCPGTIRSLPVVVLVNDRLPTLRASGNSRPFADSAGLGWSGTPTRSCLRRLTYSSGRRVPKQFLPVNDTFSRARRNPGLSASSVAYPACQQADEHDRERGRRIRRSRRRRDQDPDEDDGQQPAERLAASALTLSFRRLERCTLGRLTAVCASWQVSTEHRLDGKVAGQLPQIAPGS